MITGKKGGEGYKLVNWIIALVVLIAIVFVINQMFPNLFGAFKGFGEFATIGTKTALDVNKDVFNDLSRDGVSKLEKNTLDKVGETGCTTPEGHSETSKQYEQLITLCEERQNKEKDFECEQIDKIIFNLAQCHVEFNKCEQAIPLYEKILNEIKEGAYIDNSRFGLAKCQISLGKLDDAEKAAQGLNVAAKERILEEIRREKAFLISESTPFEKSYREALDFLQGNNPNYLEAKKRFDSLFDAGVKLANKKGFSIAYPKHLFLMFVNNQRNDGESTGVEKDLENVFISDSEILKYLVVLEFWSKFAEMKQGRDCGAFSGYYLSENRFNLMTNANFDAINFFSFTNTLFEGEPIMSRVFFESGKCFEENGALIDAREQYSYLISRYPSVDASKPRETSERVANFAAREFWLNHKPNCGKEEELQDDYTTCNAINQVYLDKTLVGRKPIWKEFTCWWYDEPDILSGHFSFGKDNECRTCAVIDSCEDYGGGTFGRQSFNADSCNFGCR